MLHTCIFDIPFNVLSLTYHFDSILLCLILFPQDVSSCTAPHERKGRTSILSPYEPNTALCLLFPGFPTKIVYAFHQNV